MKKIEIGVLTKPQGLKGEVRVKLFNNDFSVFENVNYIFLDEQKMKILAKTNRNTFVILKLENLNDINEAEKLRGCKVFVNYDDINLEEDELLVSEMLGYSITTTSGESLGVVKDISNYGAGDVYTVSTPDNKEFLFINANNVIIEINKTKKAIIVNEIKLKELSV